MPTLILPPRFTEDTNLMWKAALDAGWEVERLSGWRPPAELRAAEAVLYGEPLFAAVVSDGLGLALLEPTFSWLTTLAETWTRRWIRFTTLAEAREQPGPAFIKPADDKCFATRVYPSGGELPDHASLSAATPVLVAEPVVWEVEFRCFVLERTLATSSVSLRGGELARNDDGSWAADEDETRQAQRFVTDLLADPEVRIPPAVVIDVGRIRGRGWAVVEANAAWGSGVYGCQPSRVLDVLRRASIPRGSLTATDAAWVPVRT